MPNATVGRPGEKMEEKVEAAVLLLSWGFPGVQVITLTVDNLGLNASPNRYFATQESTFEVLGPFWKPFAPNQQPPFSSPFPTSYCLRYLDPACLTFPELRIELVSHSTFLPVWTSEGAPRGCSPVTCPEAMKLLL